MDKYDLNWDVRRALFSSAEWYLENALDVWTTTLKDFTPEDEFKTTTSYRVEIEKKEKSLVWYIFIDPKSEAAAYSEYLEFGSWTIKNYYKDWGRRSGGTPFTTWVWARMFARTNQKLKILLW